MSLGNPTVATEIRSFGSIVCELLIGQANQQLAHTAAKLPSVSCSCELAKLRASCILSKVCSVKHVKALIWVQQYHSKGEVTACACSKLSSKGCYHHQGTLAGTGCGTWDSVIHSEQRGELRKGAKQLMCSLSPHLAKKRPVSTSQLVHLGYAPGGQMV